MSLDPGTTLSPYAVTAKIGEGGMGEVYQARDTKLDRDVALKVLPDAFTSDPERLARFEREAKVLASLNHPNIGGIHGLEESDGVKALVLELVEEPTLADRIANGPIPLDDALPIARQMADALEAAHEQGVIHRDLKPANIKVKSDGTVKVLDFGLAKAFQPEASDPNMSLSPTISLTAAAWTWTGSQTAPADVMRFVIEPSSDAPLGSGSRQDIAISPDGTQIVYNGRAPGGGSPQLNLRSLAESEGAPVRGSVRGYAPFLSPDGAWIGFVTQGPAATTLVKLSRLSGPWVELTESPSAIFGASWGPDDQIVFGTERSGLFRVSAVAATRRT